jgi:PAS domain S-box-containing protein
LWNFFSCFFYGRCLPDDIPIADKGQIMKILIVDDDLSNLFLLQTVLEKNGYAVIQATNGEKALEVLRSESIDLIVSDILMPVMDGYHLCQECKKDAELSRIPFIFCSGTYTDQKDENLSLQFGADAFIAKPFQNKQLLETISHVFEKKNTRQSTSKDTLFEHDIGVYKLYSERLVNKLEEKMLALDKEKMALEMEVAERRRVEQELRKSRNFTENLFNTAPGLMLILDPEGRIIRFNPYMEKVSGYRLEEVKGCFWKEVFSPEDPKKSTPHTTETDDDHPSGNISTITTKDGKKKKIIWFDSTLKNEDGQTLGLLAVGQDITRQLERQKQAIDARVQQTVSELAGSFSEKLDTIAAILFDHLAFLKKIQPVSDKTGEQIQQLDMAVDFARSLAEQIRNKN